MTPAEKSLFAFVESIGVPMERDDDRGGVYDAADRDYDDWRQAQDDEREQILNNALDEARKRGVSVESLKVLAREAGATHWALVNSLKG